MAAAREELGGGDETSAGSGGPEHFGRALFEQPGTLPVLDVGAVAGLQDDGVHARAVEELRQQQAGGTGADDADPGAGRGAAVRGDCHADASSSMLVNTSCATANALLAAGTPQ